MDDDQPALQAHLLEQIIGKSWDELEVLEHAGYLLFPAKLYKRKKDGTVEGIDVRLRAPREHELRDARIAARELGRKAGLDPKLDRDMIDNYEVICTLAQCVRNATPPHEPWEPNPERLERLYDKASLMHLWGLVDEVQAVINPHPSTISEAECWALVAAVAKARNLFPLHAYASGVQTNFVVFMADQLLILQASRLSSEPSEPSTPDSSDSSRSRG